MSETQEKVTRSPRSYVLAEKVLQEDGTSEYVMIDTGGVYFKTTRKAQSWVSQKCRENPEYCEAVRDKEYVLLSEFNSFKVSVSPRQVLDVEFN